MLDRRFDIYERRIFTPTKPPSKKSVLPLGNLRILCFGVWLSVLVLAGTFYFAFPAPELATTEASWRGEVANKKAIVSGFVVTKAKEPNVYAASYLLLDERSGELLLCHNCQENLPVASTTKMTTALTAVELMPLDQVITVPASAPAINGSKIGLRTGEKITLANLLKGLLIQSGNDAALTIASVIDQTEGEGKFVEKMNQYMARHQLSQTTFADPAGLDDDSGRSSSYELAQIARLLLKNETLAPIVRTGEASIANTTGDIVHELKNSNRLVIPSSSYYMADALGIKTGFTLAAGHCLVSALDWQGRKLISVVLNTTETDLAASARESKRIFSWAKSSLETATY